MSETSGVHWWGVALGCGAIATLASCILDRGGLIPDDLSAGGSGGSVTPECRLPEDCQDLPEDSTCRQRTCDNETCGLVYANDGTSCPEAEQGECRAGSCLSPNGVPCSAGAQCLSGACSTDGDGMGVCCESACEGGCVSCRLAGFVGQCRPQPAAQDPEDGCIDGICDGSGHCAQGTVQWSKSFGGTGDDLGRGLAVAATGSIAIGVEFDGSLDVDGTMHNVSPSNDPDLVVAGLDDVGARLWSNHAAGSGTDGLGDVAIDAQGQVVAAGGFEFDLNLGGATLNASIGSDSYVAKYDEQGTHLWSKSFGISGDNRVTSVGVDAMGNIVIGGSYFGSVSFGGQTLTAIGGLDIFVAAFTPSGDHSWSHSYGTASDEVLLDLEVAPAGDVVIAGSYQQTLSFGGPSVTLVSGVDGFVAKLDAAGNTQWATALAGSGNERAVSLHIESDGELLVTGDFDTDLSVGQSLQAVSNQDIYVAKLDAAGQPVWASPFGTSGVQTAYQVTGDRWGNVIVAATTDGSIDFGTGALTSAGGDDVVIAKLDAEATALWSQRYGDNTDQRPSRLRTDDTNRIVLLGEYEGSITFAPGHSHTSQQAFDVFLLSLAP